MLKPPQEESERMGVSMEADDEMSVYRRSRSDKRQLDEI